MNYETFHKTTYSTNMFQICDVEGDNKCFYRSVVQCLLANSDLDTINEPKTLVMKRVFNSFNPTEVFNQLNLGASFSDKATYNLEVRVMNWLDKNRDQLISQIGLPIKDIVEMTHEIDMDNYIIRDFELYPIWGGLPEQIAVANIYRLPVYIFRPVRFNKTNKRVNEGVIKGQTANKDVRLQLTQVIQPNTLPQAGSNNRPIYLLWKRYTSGDDHYMALIPHTNDLTV